MSFLMFLGFRLDSFRLHGKIFQEIDGVVHASVIFIFGGRLQGGGTLKKGGLISENPDVRVQTMGLKYFI